MCSRLHVCPLPYALLSSANHASEMLLQAQPHRTAFTAEALARTLAAAARSNALDAQYRSPWIVEAAAAGVLPFWKAWRPRGGKLDDCTVVVIFAEPGPEAPARGAQPTEAPVSAAA